MSSRLCFSEQHDISDFDGNFLIEKVAKESYNPVNSNISYDNKFFRVEVGDEGETTVNTELKPASIDIDEVQNVAKRPDNTEISMLSSLKVGSLIGNAITAHQISKLWNKDAAEEIPSFTNDMNLLIRFCKN